jgi:uncharacterized protein
MIERSADRQRLELAMRRNQVVLLVGPRQSGKTTIARTVAELGGPNYFDLEEPVDLARLDQPMTALRPLTGTVVIDEVQRRPDLFPVLRVLADREDRPATFLVLGSAEPAALRQASESLTGRLGVVELAGFGPAEMADVTASGTSEAPTALDRLWLRGGMPRAALADDDDAAFDWLAGYVRNLVERDLFEFDVRRPAAALRRFLAMVAHVTARIWNNADPARSLGISEHTVRRYLDLATDALLVRQLPAWSANVGKRQVRAPKVVVRDCGLSHALLGIASWTELLRHPVSGSTWESLVIEEVHRVLSPPESYSWATHGGAELDLFLPVVPRSGIRLGIEVKRADAPTLTPSMRSALGDLELDRLVVVHPGSRRYELTDRVEVVPFDVFADPVDARAALLGE